MAKTLIKGGTVVTAIDQMPADVLVEDGKVVALLGREHTVEPDEVVDATDKLVLPGGIDVHTHMELPFGGTFASDDFETGTRAAAWGGTTTIVD
ncbi:MAG TPA: dihydropyrimidinase, partial [Acidimicrobiia bacterium]|nr:dihydropyrimidinase [Acidimicrobiia bacterium]